MKWVMVNYNFDPSWILGYTDDYLVYDRSDHDEGWTKNLDQSKVIHTENVGNVDYDKLCYLFDNYYDLPEVFLWGKTNLFKYISKEEFDKVKDSKTFTPLLTMNHHIYSDTQGQVNYYQGGMYWERNNSWFLNPVPAKYINSFGEWAYEFGLESPLYIPFAPGGNYILTRETVHKYSRDFYGKMANTLPYTQLPGEAQCAERSYYLMWK